MNVRSMSRRLRSAIHPTKLRYIFGYMNKLINKKRIAFFELPGEVKRMMDHWGKEYPAARLLTLMMELDSLEDYILQHDELFKLSLGSLVPKRGSLLVHGFSKFIGPIFVGFVNSILEGEIRASQDGYSYFASFQKLHGIYCIPFFAILNPRLDTEKRRLEGNINFEDILCWVCPDGLRDFFIDCLKEAVQRGLMVNGRPFTEDDFQERIHKLISYKEFRNINF